MGQNRYCDRLQSYTSFVAARSLRNPCFQKLSSFLQDGSAKHNSCRIVCLEFTSAPGPSKRSSIHPDDLATLLGSKCKATNDIRGRLLLIEDVSRDVIETLGSMLNVDPFFFASHVDTSKVELATSRPSIAILPSTTRFQNFLNLHYHRVLELENKNTDRLLLRDMNISRSVKLSPYIKGAKIGLARHCCSILKTETSDGHWLGKSSFPDHNLICVNANVSKSRIGLILMDAPICNNYISNTHNDKSVDLNLHTRLFKGGFQDFLPGPKFYDSIDTDPGPPKSSLLETIEYYMSIDQSSGTNMECPSLLALSYYPLRIIAAEWTIYLELMFHSIKQYEYSPTTIGTSVEQIAVLNADIRSLQRWARSSIATAIKIRYVLDFLANRVADDRDMEASTLIRKDYQQISSSVDNYSHRLEIMVSIATSLIQTIDCRRSLTETMNISRLSYLALAFIPMTFVSSLFSMNSDVAPGGKNFGLYFAVSIPLSVLVYLVLHPPSKTPGFLAEFKWRPKKLERFVV